MTQNQKQISNNFQPKRLMYGRFTLFLHPLLEELSIRHFPYGSVCLSFSGALVFTQFATNLSSFWNVLTIEGGKGFFRDPWKALFISCELWNGKFFLVKRDLVTEPWTANHRFFTRIAKWLIIFILKCDCKPWFSFSCKKFSSKCFKK